MFSYNHTRMMHECANGAKIVNTTPAGCEYRLYNVGDVVHPTSVSPYNFVVGTIIDSYKNNGYTMYVVEYRVGKQFASRIFRQKDIAL
jgi:hypothetical protein